MSDYPKFLCRPGRPGFQELAWGVWIEPGSAVDEADEIEKLANGWFLTPADIPTDGPEPAPRKPGRPPKVRDDGADS